MKKLFILMSVCIAAIAIGITSVNAKKEEVLSFIVEQDIPLDLSAPDYAAVNEYIVQNIEPLYDRNRFQEYVIPYDDNNGLIELNFMMGDLETDSQINIFVENGYVTFISVCGEFDMTAPQDPITYTITEEEVRELALKDANFDRSTERVVSQNVKRKFDTITNKPYYFVITDFQNLETGNFFSMGYTHSF